MQWASLDWYDYTGQPSRDAIHDAQTSCGVVYLVNKAYNYPPAIAYAQMIPEESWVKKWKDTNASHMAHLLEHEQGHFDLVELFKRKICDSVSHAWGKAAKNIDAIIQ